MKIFYSLLLLFVMSSCFKGESADLVIHNAQIHTMVDGDPVFEAIAIRDGKIIEVGPERQILNRYSAEEYIDAQLKDIYPGFTDAHGHIFSYAKQKLSVDLVGCRSYSELINRLEKYKSRHNPDFIIGRGWDQSNWSDTTPFSNKRLNEVFPDIPVCLFRIDGHALIANDMLIQQSNLIEKFRTTEELHSAGSLVFYDTLFSGIAVDNAMNPILEKLPEFKPADLKKAILEIQTELLSFGITGVHEAGIEFGELQLFEELVDQEKLSMNIYAMLLPTEKNIEFAKENGIYTNKNLLVRSFKVYGDGALGSRGAFLKKAYTDQHDHSGYLTTSTRRLEEIAEISQEVGYQMNTHAIGDSTCSILLEIYEKVYASNPDHRWRLEHAQVIDPKDIERYSQSGTIPSIQPTHATSDKNWAENRIGKKRLKGAYAYKSLLKSFGIVAIGTDFPVESPDPFLTLHSAVNRKDKDNLPTMGFLPQESISFENCIKGMTFWAAMASFQENEIGQLSKGMDATLVVFEKPVQNTSFYQANYAYITLIKGKKAYSLE